MIQFNFCFKSIITKRMVRLFVLQNCFHCSVTHIHVRVCMYIYIHQLVHLFYPLRGFFSCLQMEKIQEIAVLKRTIEENLTFLLKKLLIDFLMIFDRNIEQTGKYQDPSHSFLTNGFRSGNCRNPTRSDVHVLTWGKTKQK